MICHRSASPAKSVVYEMNNSAKQCIYRNAGLQTGVWRRRRGGFINADLKIGVPKTTSFVLMDFLNGQPA
jgi:hypothetical protein